MRKIYLLLLGVLLVGVGIVIYYYIPSRTVLYENQGDKIQNAIDRGLSFLQSRQQSSGEFFLYICDNTQPERCDPIRSAGSTAGVLSLLEGVEDSRIKEIAQKAIPFILSGMELAQGAKHGAWGLFYKSDPRYGRTPPDIDDTALTSSFLLKNNISFPNDEKEFDRYRNADGLYYNWLSDTWNKSEQDRQAFAGVTLDQLTRKEYLGVDCMVNVDVLNYFALKKNQPSQLCSYINETIEKKLYPQCTFYYRNPYVFFAAIAGGVKNSNTTCLAPSVPLIREELISTQRTDGTWSSNLFNNVMAARALLFTDYRGEALDRAIANLLQLQRQDGGWDNAVIFPDLVNPVFYGSRELITAGAIQVLDTYKKSL